MMPRPVGRGEPSALIDRLTTAEHDAAVPELAAMLAEAVAGGASLGFREPFRHDDATAWWRGALAGGRQTVWVARDGDGIIGTVTLVYPEKPNAAHRGEVVKLMVRPSARGRGLGRMLLATAEAAAVEAGLTLLMLDTETGSPAERLYESAGWTRYGIVPGYAADPAGTPQPCSFFYKRLS